LAITGEEETGRDGEGKTGEGRQGHNFGLKNEGK